MKGYDIITAARPILQDTVQDSNERYRWSDDFMYKALDDGILLLHSVVPSTRYVNGLVQDRVALPVNYDMEFPIDDRYREALVYYVVYRCYLVDDTDTVNAQLAENYYAKAIQRMRL